MKIRNNILKIVLVSLLTLGFSACDDNESASKISSEKKVRLPKPEWEDRLTNYKDTGKWFQLADDDEIAAYNIANTYSIKIKDYKKAIEWYLYSDSIKTNSENLFNMALTYEDIKDYNNSIKYYQKASFFGHDKAINNLALLYKKEKKDYLLAEKWYKKAIERENVNAIKGISDLYYNNLKDYIKTSAYMINLIAYPNFTKDEVINRLKNYYKFNNETIKKGYELQLKMEGLPRRYKGELGL